jgi:hypothetical protein
MRPAQIPVTLSSPRIERPMLQQQSPMRFARGHNAEKWHGPLDPEQESGAGKREWYSHRWYHGLSSRRYCRPTGQTGQRAYGSKNTKAYDIMPADQPIVHQDARSGHVTDHVVRAIDALRVGDKDASHLLIEVP